MPVRIDGPGRRPGLLVSQSVAQPNVAAGVFQIIIPDTVVYDPAGQWRMAQANIIPTVPGWYRFAGAFSLNLPAGTSSFLVALFCNSTEAMRGVQLQSASTTVVIPIGFDIPIGLGASNKLTPGSNAWVTGVAYDLRVFQSGTGLAATVNPSSNAQGPVNWISVEYLGDS